ncbi:gluconokinase [Bacillus sp. FJAT-45037]|uniref:gluconokinase n=1 Tax=Bacillus sp. FJAT-45037 TaxID=2011007 RepID=UPI000C245513|nr:gluconokinase [Bacillus sp. FJAT-45037]
MTKKLVIGVDIGTTSAKSVLFEQNGTVVTESEKPLSTVHPKKGWAEQCPLEIEKAVLSTLRQVVEQATKSGHQISSIGLSAAMHTLICVNENWEPLSPSIIWADGRSTEQAERIKQSEVGHLLYQRTGTPIHPMSPFTKLIWMKENENKAYLEAKRFVSIKEFITGRWFQQAAVDYSTASATGLFNIHEFTWDQVALDLAGIKIEQLSKPVEPTYQFTGLNPTLAVQLGLPQDIPFVAGGSDGALANIGLGAIHPGETALTIGTSGAIRQFSHTPVLNKNQSTFCYAFSKNSWIVGGPSNNGGNILNWVRSIFEDEQLNAMSYEKLFEMIESVEVGSNGLLFLPFLNGERAPIWNSNIRGSYIGLSIEHQKKHIIRSTLEGINLNLLMIDNLVSQSNEEEQSIYASGGFARSSCWVQMIANIFDKEVRLPESHQSSAWGAAWISLLSIGEVESLSSIKTSIPFQTAIQPNEHEKQLYKSIYKEYKELYDRYKNLFTT